jgi:hypothetical protein
MTVYVCMRSQNVHQWTLAVPGALMQVRSVETRGSDVVLCSEALRHVFASAAKKSQNGRKTSESRSQSATLNFC